MTRMNSSTASTRRWSSAPPADAELGEDAGDVLLDRVRGDDELLGDALVRAALGHQLEHLALARREAVERVVAAAPAEHVGDDRRVEHRAAGGDAPDGVGEAAEVGHAVLEQVADALGVVADQVDRVALLGVLARARARRRPGCVARISIAARRPSSVLSGGIWTSTIATSGLCAATLRSRSGASAGLGDDLEARVAEQPHDALAQQRLVFGDDDASSWRSQQFDEPRRGELGLGHEAARAGALDVADRGRVERGDEHDVAPSNAPRRAHAVAVGQVDVQQHAVRAAARAAAASAGRDVPGHAHDLVAPRLQQHLRRRPEGGGVIDDEDGAGHATT